MHILRYEDLVARPGEVIPELIKFIFNAKSIEGTLVESYINLAVAEGAQKTYKPRVGRANANMDKYSQEMLDFIVEKCSKMLKEFGFYHLFNQPDSDDFTYEGQCPWIKKFNEDQLAKILAAPRINIDKLPFCLINKRDDMIREIEFNPIEYPTGRSFMKVSKYMMARATKIGKTLI